MDWEKTYTVQCWVQSVMPIEANDNVNVVSINLYRLDSDRRASSISSTMPEEVPLGTLEAAPSRSLQGGTGAALAGLGGTTVGVLA